MPSIAPPGFLRQARGQRAFKPFTACRVDDPDGRGRGLRGFLHRVIEHELFACPRRLGAGPDKEINRAQMWRRFAARSGDV